MTPSNSGKNWCKKLITPPPPPPVVKKRSTSGGVIFTPVPPAAIPDSTDIHQILHQHFTLVDAVDSHHRFPLFILLLGGENDKGRWELHVVVVCFTLNAHCDRFCMPA